MATVVSSAFKASNTRVARAGFWTIELSMSSIVKRPAQVAFNRETPSRLLRLLRLIDFRLAVVLSLLDGELADAEQLLRIQSGRHQRDTDRTFDFDLGL